MCVLNSPLFQHCQVYDWPPFFNKKYMNVPIFLDSCVKGPIFLTSWYMHIFFAQRFFEATYPLGITWIDYDICVITSTKWVQKIKGQYMNRSTFWMIKYMNGSVFSKARYMNGVGFEILARTSIPKLPLSYPPESFPHYFIYISNFRSQITYSFVKCGCSLYCFPHSLNSDMSRYEYLEVFKWVPWNWR